MGVYTLPKTLYRPLTAVVLGTLRRHVFSRERERERERETKRERERERRREREERKAQKRT